MFKKIKNSLDEKAFKDGKLIDAELYMKSRVNVKGKLLCISIFGYSDKDLDFKNSDAFNLIKYLGLKLGYTNTNNNAKNRVSYDLGMTKVFVYFNKFNAIKIDSFINSLITKFPKSCIKCCYVSLQNIDNTYKEVINLSADAVKNKYTFEGILTTTRSFSNQKSESCYDDANKKLEIVQNYMFSSRLPKDVYKNFIKG